MKKLIFIFALMLIVFSVSACTKISDNQDKDNFQDQSSLADSPNDNSKNSNNLASDDNSVALVQKDLKVTENKEPLNNDPVKENKTMQSPNKQENLLAVYSQALIKTNYGDIKVKFYSNEAPITVNNFLNLAKEGFYNQTKFHRVIKDFMIQGGDPLSKDNEVSLWGTGGPNYRFQDEFNSHKLVAGSLAMANSGPGTNGSQFFIVTAESTPWLDGRHTNFGEVVSGMDIVKKIEAVETGINDRPVAPVIVNSIELMK
jgi:cyclophilin family peptidyl-prolyl cis-trans isomerase